MSSENFIELNPNLPTYATAERRADIWKGLIPSLTYIPNYLNPGERVHVKETDTYWIGSSNTFFPQLPTGTPVQLNVLPMYVSFTKGILPTTEGAVKNKTRGLYLKDDNTWQYLKFTQNGWEEDLPSITTKEYLAENTNDIPFIRKEQYKTFTGTDINVVENLNKVEDDFIMVYKDGLVLTFNDDYTIDRENNIITLTESVTDANILIILYRYDLITKNNPRGKKVFYVSEDGDDDDPLNYDGRSFDAAFKTVTKALKAVADEKIKDYADKMQVSYADASIATNEGYQWNVPITYGVRVNLGKYEISGNTRVPAHTSLLGESLRGTLLEWIDERDAPPEDRRNMLLVNSGCYIYNMRFINGPGIDNLKNPKKGFYIAFQPGAFITQSPYVQNCTAGWVPPEKANAPLAPKFEEDPPNPNPLVGNGPGGMLVDPSVLDGYSPLASMIVDAYTQAAFNGIGVCVRGRGFAQMVSFYTNFSRIGVLALDGGHVALSNSNTTWGDYGLVANGSRKVVYADISKVGTITDTKTSDDLRNVKNAAVTYMFNQLANDNSLIDNEEYGNPQTEKYKATKKDADLLMDALADDFLGERPSLTARFVQGQFTAEDTTLTNSRTTASGAVTVYPLNIAQDFVSSFDYLRDGIKNYMSFSTIALEEKLDALINMVQEVHQDVVLDNNPDSSYVEEFGSLIQSTAHDFAYCGTGVNFNGLPRNQGGVGIAKVELQVVQKNGGRVFQSSGDELGDFRIGNDFVIRQETGTIQGRAFSKSLFALVTPFTLALQTQK